MSAGRGSRVASGGPRVAGRGQSLILAVAAGLLAACGGGGSAPPAPSPGDNPNQIVISAAGAFTPTEITVAPGSRVLFINNHSRPHQVSSDPHPEHDACPEINSVGLLGPGQRRETSNLVTVRTCGVHDHDDPDNPSLKARIVIR